MNAQEVGYKAKSFEPRNLAFFFLLAFGISWATVILISVFDLDMSTSGSGPINPLVVLIGVMGTNYLIVYVVPRDWYQFTIFIVLGLALLGELLMRPIRLGPPTSPIVLWVPLGFHLFFLVAGLLSGSILQAPLLLMMSLLMLLATLYLHRPWKMTQVETLIE